MSYREFKEILEVDYARRRDLAEKIVEELMEENLPPGSPASAAALSARDQAEILVALLELFIERNEVSADAWKRVGYAGNALTLWGKVGRLMNKVWYRTTPIDGSEKPLDDAADAINYALFFIRGYLAGDERGIPA